MFDEKIVSLKTKMIKKYICYCQKCNKKNPSFGGCHVTERTAIKHNEIQLLDEARCAAAKKKKKEQLEIIENNTVENIENTENIINHELHNADHIRIENDVIGHDETNNYIENTIQEMPRSAEVRDLSSTRVYKYKLSATLHPKDAVLKNLLEGKVKHNLSNAAVDSQLKLTALTIKMLNPTLDIPFKSYSDALKRLNYIIPTFENINVDKLSKDYHFSLEQWIVMLYQDPSQRKNLTYGWEKFQTSLSNNNPLLEDFWSSNRIKDLVLDGLIKPGIDLVILLTGDGLQLFRHKNHETGFLDVTILNFPPNIRSKFTFVMGTIAGPKAPINYQKTFQTFFEELKYLEDYGVLCLNNEGDSFIVRKVFVAILSGDIKFLEKFDNKYAAGAYRCCRRCTIPGTLGGKLSRTVYYPSLG